MKTYKVKINQGFIGRHYEKAKLIKIANNKEAAIVVVYGRRRVGKTELIEQTFANRSLLKFEGREKQSAEIQKAIFLEKLADYAEDSSLIDSTANSWRSILAALAEIVSQGTWTIFLEEFQWLSSYQTELISELKYIWDNSLRHNPNLLLILCGSSPSFMIKEVVYSKALHNRSQHELCLRPFALHETKEFLGARFSNEEVLRTQLSIGGIPEYLRYIRDAKALLPGLSSNSFLPEAFFLYEQKRVFVSSLADNKYYEAILNNLAHFKYATRGELLRLLSASSGGNASSVIKDLEICGFIQAYSPINAPENSRNVRYQIQDNYLQFYYRFIASRIQEIQKGAFIDNPQRALSLTAFDQFLGYAFERWCQAESHKIAKILEFSGIEYRSGAYFKRTTIKDLASAQGFQIDLVFKRADGVFTLCEIKHNLKPVDRQLALEIISKFEQFPIKPRQSKQRVLITTGGATDEVMNGGYFDRVIGIQDLFEGRM